MERQVRTNEQRGRLVADLHPEFDALRSAMPKVDRDRLDVDILLLLDYVNKFPHLDEIRKISCRHFVIACVVEAEDDRVVRLLDFAHLPENPNPPDPGARLHFSRPAFDPVESELPSNLALNLIWTDDMNKMLRACSQYRLVAIGVALAAFSTTPGAVAHIRNGDFTSEWALSATMAQAPVVLLNAPHGVPEAAGNCGRIDMAYAVRGRELLPPVLSLAMNEIIIPDVPREIEDRRAVVGTTWYIAPVDREGTGLVGVEAIMEGVWNMRDKHYRAPQARLPDADTNPAPTQRSVPKGGYAEAEMGGIA